MKGARHLINDQVEKSYYSILRRIYGTEEEAGIVPDLATSGWLDPGCFRTCMLWKVIQQLETFFRGLKKHGWRS
jgi:hypothetical protein